MLPRRRFLQVAAASAAVAASPLVPASAARAAAGDITDLGPASVASPLGNGVFVGGILYVGSRGLSPNVVGAYDLASDKIVAHYEIPTGIGIWAMCASGTDVYVATHVRSDLYRIDTLTGKVTKVGGYPDQYVWTMAAAPDGKVYLGCSEPGRVWEYDPATGTSRDLGQPAPGEAYVRSIAADDRYVYCGIGSHAHLIAIDRATGETRDLLPAEVASRDWVASMSISDTHIAGGLNSLAELLVLRKDDPADHRVVKATAAGEKYTVAVLVHEDSVYFAGRPTGTFYRYHLDTGVLDVLGVPYFEAATHRILAHEGRIYGVQDNAVFVYDPATGDIEYRNLVQRGLRAAPEEPMSVHSDGRRVYVGGKSGADVHDLATGAVTRLGIPGEPKTLVTVRDLTYLGVYTQAALYAHRAGDPEPELLLRAGNQQDRPRDLAYDEKTRLIVMPTQPEPGHENGALTLYSVKDGTHVTYRPIVERQTVYAVTTRRGVAYLGTQTQEGLGLPPVTTTARLAAFDLTSRKLLWQVEPVPGAPGITGLDSTSHALYGITRGGLLFEYDLDRGAVTRTLQVSARGGDLLLVGRTAYTGDKDAVYAVDLVRWRATALATGLAGEWFGGEPKLALDPSHRALYSIKGRNLIRIAI
ncbi:PQQ-binding-like beta-propeller repeat protein [Streptosporangium sandarakinum]